MEHFEILGSQILCDNDTNSTCNVFPYCILFNLAMLATDLDLPTESRAEYALLFSPGRQGIL